MNLDHIAIYAKDMELMVSFYNKLLGSAEVGRTYHKDGTVKMIRVLVNDKQTIEFFNFEKVNSKKNGYINGGFMHVGFSVKDIDLTIENIKKSGVSTIKEKYKGVDGYYHIFLEDPEFNQLELTQRC